MHRSMQWLLLIPTKRTHFPSGFATCSPSPPVAATCPAQAHDRPIPDIARKTSIRTSVARMTLFISLSQKYRAQRKRSERRLSALHRPVSNNSGCLRAPTARRTASRCGSCARVHSGELGCWSLCTAGSENPSFSDFYAFESRFGVGLGRLPVGVGFRAHPGTQMAPQSSLYSRGEVRHAIREVIAKVVYRGKPIFP